MTPDVALALADCLDAIERREVTLDEYLARHPDRRLALSELVPVAQRLWAVPHVRPSPDFRADARARLIARLPPRHAPRRMRLTLVRALAVVIALVAFSGSVVAASAQSLPTEWLYPVKITFEQVRLALSPDVAARGELSLGFADERLSEVQRLIERGQGAEVGDTLDAFAAQIQSAADMARNLPAGADRDVLYNRLRQSADRSAAVLSDNEVRLPASVQPAMARAREALRAVPPRDPPDEPVPLPTETQLPTSAPTATLMPTPQAARTRVPPMTATPRPSVPPTPTASLTFTLPARHWPTPPPTDWPTPPATRQPTVEPSVWPPTWPATQTPWATIVPWPTRPIHGSPVPTQTWPTPMWPTPRHR
jgi:hypothetical protein